MIYLDYAATTPVDKKVLQKMLPFFDKNFANASSIHRPGQLAQEAVELAQKIIAQSLNCQPHEVIFTSGATESNNLVFQGIFKALAADSKFKNQKLHFITSNIEHHCVLDSLAALQKESPQRIQITYLKVNSQGLINPEKLKKAIQKNTVLVSIMFVNNEIGSVQPIEKIGRLIASVRKKRNKNNLPLYFHSDAAQAFSYFDCDTRKLNLDLVTLSAHKIYGPKGVGALAVKTGVRLTPMQYGGGHQRGLRSGTLNVSGIIGMGEAVNLAQKQRKDNTQKITALRDYFIAQIEKQIPGAKLNGPRKKRSPNNINFSFAGAEGESIVLLLSQKGIAVSTGSACSAESLESSHVQLAIHPKNHLSAHSSIRFSLGKFTTKQELATTVKVLKNVLKKLRKTSKDIKV
ncbi:MAG: cysteine desulfurase family protein [Patescibacteria group bacterium]